jgi:hypothetical protein
MGVASTLVAYFNVDGSFARPKLAALIFGVFWLAFTCLAIWMLLAYYRSRLLVGATSLRQIGVFRDRQVRFSKVEQLKWRRFPQGGGVRMDGDFGVVKISFGDFQRDARQELIAGLRAAVAAEKQAGWQEFCAQFADSPCMRQRSRRTRALLQWVLGAHAAAFGAMWLWSGELQYLAFCGINAAVAAYLVRQGRRAQTACEA